MRARLEEVRKYLLKIKRKLHFLFSAILSPQQYLNTLNNERGLIPLVIGLGVAGVAGVAAIWGLMETKDAIGGALIGAFMSMSFGALKLGVYLVNVAVHFTNSFFNVNPATNGFDPMENWRVTRNFSLGLFGMVILVIAFMNLLRLQIQEWGVNRMIPKLFITIFFVIFSKFICISIINFATAIANSWQQTSLFDKLNNLLGLATGTFPSAQPTFGTAFMIFICSSAAFLVLAVLSVILYFRALVLAMLVVISPLAFTIMVLPWTRQYFQQWWKYFLKWTFFFPVCIFILFLGFGFIPVSTTSNIDSLQNSLQVTAPTVQSEGAGFFTVFSYLVIALLTIIMSVYAPLKMLGAFGSFAQGALRKLGKNAYDIPGLRRGKRAWINPATYKRLWDSRSEMRKAAMGEDIGAKQMKLRGFFDPKKFDEEGMPKKGLIRGREGLASWATGIDVRSKEAYEKKQIDAINAAVKNPKAWAEGVDYYAALAKYGADHQITIKAKSKWDELATTKEKVATEALIKEMGGLKNALPVLGKAYAERGHGQAKMYEQEHTKELLHTIGAMKNGKVVADVLRKQIPSLALGLAPHQLSLDDIKTSKAYAYDKFINNPDKEKEAEYIRSMQSIGAERARDIREHSGASSDVLNAFAVSLADKKVGNRESAAEMLGVALDQLDDKIAELKRLKVVG